MLEELSIATAYLKDRGFIRNVSIIDSSQQFAIKPTRGSRSVDDVTEMGAKAIIVLAPESR